MTRCGINIWKAYDLIIDLLEPISKTDIIIYFLISKLKSGIMFLTCNANLNNHLYSVLTAIPYEGVKIREKGLKINRKDPPHTPQHNANFRVVGRFENLGG